MNDPRAKWLLLASVFVIATCGLIYELVAGTLASYLLGDSVTQFSTVIGVYLFSMGIGSWLSKGIDRHVGRCFVQAQFLLGVIGGGSAPLLFLLFHHVSSFRTLLYSLIVLIGSLVGIEIPLLLRLLKDRLEFKDLVARVLTFDYVGALIASLLFPLLLVPKLGLIRTSLFFGLLNVAVGVGSLRLLEPRGPWRTSSHFVASLIAASLLTAFALADHLLSWSESELYPHTIFHARSTPYQRIVLTRGPNDTRLYLNGNLQFSSRDEYRYHEALVHPALAAHPSPQRVLILGGGDGFAAREILRYPAVQSITLVDLDPEITQLFSRNPVLAPLNQHSLSSPRVSIINTDAFTWLDSATNRFDFAVIDFPDPSNFSLGKLYSTTFFHRLRRVLEPNAAFAIQCTSPYVARRSFWCVDKTIRSCGFHTAPYHLYVPSFGEWGFVWASLRPIQPATQFPNGLRFINPATAAALFQFPPDMDSLPVDINRLNNQALVRYFEEEWSEHGL